VSDYVVTPRAQADLGKIYDHSLETWGEVRTVHYMEALISRFAWLAAHPAMGRPRDDVAKGYRCFRQGSHIVFYVQKADGIYIVGAPHGSMDIDAYFEERDKS